MCPKEAQLARNTTASFLAESLLHRCFSPGHHSSCPAHTPVSNIGFLLTFCFGLRPRKRGQTSGADVLIPAARVE